MPKVFICYRRDDSEFAAQMLFEQLRARLGDGAVVFDVETIQYGVDFVRYLDEQVAACDVLLAVIGDRWLTAEKPDGGRRLDDPDDFVRIEIASALTRGKWVVPVLVGRAAAMPRAADLPDDIQALARRNAAEVRPGRDFQAHLERLFRGIDRLLEAPGASPAPVRATPPPAPTTPAPSPVVQPTFQPGQAIVNSIGMKLAFIPPGDFLMGSPENEKDRSAEEQQHRVRITKPFWLGVYPVTQAEYRQVMGANPSHFSSVARQNTDRFPVERVSWDDATAFHRKLSELPAEKQAGRAYRLPTEAEWEYACRAGTTTPFHFGAILNATQANCDGNYPYGTATKGPNLQRPVPVGAYPANGFGLYDMHGNVGEWCADWYDAGYYAKSPQDDPLGPDTGSNRVVRGGGWFSFGQICRSAFRIRFSPASRFDFLGFRVAAVRVEPS